MKRNRGRIQHSGLSNMCTIATCLILFFSISHCLMTFTGVTVSQGCDQLLRTLQKKKKLHGHKGLQLLIIVTTINGSSAVVVYDCP